MKPVQQSSPTSAVTESIIANTVQLHSIWLRLQEKEQAVAEKADTLRFEAQHQAALLAGRRRELDGLDARVQNQRRKLAALQDESVKLESAVTAELPTAELAETRPAILLPWAATRLVGDLRIALADVADQQQIVADQQDQMSEVKRTWLADWQSSLAALARREAELNQREETLTERELDVTRREQHVRTRNADLIRREQSLTCQEIRYATGQSRERGERGRMVAMVRSRAAVNRARAAYLARMQQRWERERQEHLAQYQDMRSACESDRHDLMKLRQMLQKKQAELSNRARYLLERELVVTQAQQQLIADDPNPAAAEQELQCRLTQLQEIVERPLRGLDKQEKELDARHAELEQFRAALLDDQRWLEEEKCRRLELQRRMQLDHANLEAARTRWQQRLRGLRGQRNHLLGQVRELKEQLERMSVMMMGEEVQGLRLVA